MLQKLEGLPANVVGVKAVGEVTKQDYLKVLDPIVDAARCGGRQLRFLYQFGPEFEHFSGGAALEDARLGISAMRVFEAIAVVTDVARLRQSIGFIRFLMPCPVQVFDNDGFDAAVEWLASLPAGGGLEHRMLSDVGVLVVEPKGPLRATDFDALALIVDPWIAAHGDLAGVVVHVAEFPGWENLGGLLHHIRFVEDHHRKVRRVALAADSKLADVVPRIAEHFVKAEVRHFGYDDIEQAIAWAGVNSAG
jgi:hypothetical protein